MRCIRESRDRRSALAAAYEGSSRTLSDRVDRWRIEGCLAGLARLLRAFTASSEPWPSPGQFCFRPERERDALFFEYVEGMTGLDMQRAWRV